MTIKIMPNSMTGEVCIYVIIVKLDVLFIAICSMSRGLCHKHRKSGKSLLFYSV